MLKRIRICSHETGFKFVENDFAGIMSPGVYWFFDPFNRNRIDIIDKRHIWVISDNMDMIVRSGCLDGEAEIIELDDSQRAAVWIDGRINRIAGTGRHVLWKNVSDVRIEIFDIGTIRLDHREVAIIASAPEACRYIDEYNIPQAHAGILYIDGKFSAELPPGRYFFWKDSARISLLMYDLREKVMDISGQEIMTSDKVTLRMNVTAAYRITDARKASESSPDVQQAVYRDIQLALRGAVGRISLDDLLSEKEATGVRLLQTLSSQAEAYGIRLVRTGIRDIILPGEMKELMNQVIEAEKSARANIIRRREETAAMRSQANTARLLEDNPVLMRLKELETLETVSKTAKLNIVLGDGGLGSRIVNMI